MNVSKLVPGSKRFISIETICFTMTMYETNPNSYTSDRKRQIVCFFSAPMGISDDRPLTIRRFAYVEPFQILRCPILIRFIHVQGNCRALGQMAGYRERGTVFKLSATANPMETSWISHKITRSTKHANISLLPHLGQNFRLSPHQSASGSSQQHSSSVL